MQQVSRVPARSARYMSVRPEIAESVLRLLDQESDYFKQAVDSSGSEDAASYRALSANLAALATEICAGRPIDLASRLESESAGDWLIECGLKYEIQRAYEGSTGWDWRYLADLAALASDIEAALKE